MFAESQRVWTEHNIHQKRLLVFILSKPCKFYKLDDINIGGKYIEDS